MTGDVNLPELAAIDSAIESGDLFLAHDRASAACARYPHEPIFRHRVLLILARLKSPRAMALYQEWGLTTVRTGNRQLDIDIASLGARLAKDQAFLASAQERTTLLRDAAERYLAIHRSSGDFYPGINAASLYLLSGDVIRARLIAADVQRQIPGDDFYAIATRAECALILGNRKLAERDLTALKGCGTNAQRMTARAQLTRICRALNVGIEILAPLKSRSVVHFIGQMPRVDYRLDNPKLKTAISRLLDELDTSVGYGALAAGADILFAEALVARGAELNVVLPFPAESFVQTSVKDDNGSEWRKRFEQCLAAAAQTIVTSDRYEDGDPLQFGYGSMVSAGLSLLRSTHLGAPPFQVAIWDGSKGAGDYGTASGVALWNKTGFHQRVLSNVGDERSGATFAHVDYPSPARDRAIHFALFGDVVGFSRLSERQISTFAERVMGTLKHAIDEVARDVLARNTWGDGIFLIFSTAISAAHAAIAMQQAMEGCKFEELGLPSNLDLRLGLHCGPMNRIVDPITGMPTFVGNHVNRAARIEPLAPPGVVYATEAFAACLALEPDAPFSCDYVGNVTAGKGAGNVRVLSLTRRRQ